MRTKGNWVNKKSYVFTESGQYIATAGKSDAKFIALCGTIANQLDEIGINAEEAINMLPEIVKRLENVWDLWNDGEVINDYIRVQRETALSARIGDILSFLKPKLSKREKQNQLQQPQPEVAPPYRCDRCVPPCSEDICADVNNGNIEACPEYKMDKQTESEIEQRRREK